MTAIFSTAQGFDMLKKAGKPVFFNANHLGSVVTIEIESIVAVESKWAASRRSIHISGFAEDGEEVDNWYEPELFNTLTLGKLSGR